MADCAACGNRLEEGITLCPQCGANLTRPGTMLQIGGWVLFFMSWIPLVVGVISAEQGNYIPMGIGLGIAAAGVLMIIVGRIRAAGSPDPTRPSAPPATAPPPSTGAALR